MGFQGLLISVPREGVYVTPGLGMQPDGPQKGEGEYKYFTRMKTETRWKTVTNKFENMNLITLLEIEAGMATAYRLALASVS